MAPLVASAAAVVVGAASFELSPPQPASRTTNAIRAEVRAM